MDKIYLDYAASTPVDPLVLKVMEPYFTEKFGNPGSIHSFGQEAIAVVDRAREIVAKILGAGFREVVFTASATEANNLAIKGSLKNCDLKAPEIVTSIIEHESVLETCRELEQGGVKVRYLPVSEKGLVSVESLKAVLNQNTVLVSIIYASNEIGTIQPVHELGKVIREFRGRGEYPLFHTDAAQALQFLSVNVEELGVDLMTLSSQKIYGPKGCGSLYIKGFKDKKVLSPIIAGGGQEFGLRSGTENVPAIVGFARAVELLEENKPGGSKKIRDLRDYFWQKLKDVRPEVELNGSWEERLPNNLNIYFPEKEADELVVALDLEGVAVSAGSACASRNPEPSYVVSSLGLGEDRAKSSLRITLGRFTTREEIDKALERIIKVLL